MRVAFAAAFAMLAFAAGCSAFAPSPTARDDAAASRAVARLTFATNTPAPQHLYVDHNGIFFEYALPLHVHSKPIVSATEAPDQSLPPAMTADQFGRVAVATPTELRFFHPPIETFEPSKAALTIPLTPAITQMGTSGAVLADVEFDPNENFWLLNNVGGSVSMVPAPLSKQSVATVTLGFGIAGTKTAGYGLLQNARFDVDASLYVYATATATNTSLLFKTAFPYVKPPSPVIGLNLSEPDFVDPSQFHTGPPISISGGVLYGQYLGLLAPPPPQQPPPPLSFGLAQFAQPFMPEPTNVFPDAMIDMLAGALVADANRNVLYALDASNGALKVFPMPFANHQVPILVLRCAARSVTACSEKPEHLFLAP